MTRQAWHQRPEETAKAFSAFTKYRDQPPATRTIVEAARAVYGDKGVLSNGTASGRIRAWMEAHEWELRARAHDEHLDALRQAAHEEATKDMVRRHAREAGEFEKALLLPAQVLLERLADPAESAEIMEAMKKMSPEVLVRLIDRAGRGHALVSRFERLTRGLSDTRAELTGAGGGPIVMTSAEAARTLAPLLGVDEDRVVDELAARRRAARDAERGKVEEGTGT